MERPHRLLLATGNPGKLREFKEILAPLEVTVVTPQEVGWDARVEEDGETLQENAAKKARAGWEASGVPTLAHDTGLFVVALGGAPGIHSARYAGEDQDPRKNCDKLLVELGELGPLERSAAFRCALALVTSEGPAEVFEGSVEGTIESIPRGEAGFGYDPLFAVGGRTFAEMAPEEKHRISHRGRALSKLKVYLERLPLKRNS